MTSECIECGAPATDTHHLVYGSGRRELSDRYGLTVRLCHRCHMLLHSSAGAEMARRYRQLGETMFLLQGHTVEEFVEIFGKNYL